MLMRFASRVLIGCALLWGAGAVADGPVCTQSAIGLERHLRQLYLDLLGRPPTLEEYRFTQRKGAILDDDVRELTTRDEFYERMKTYHRALLRANISNSIFVNGDTRLQATTAGLAPLGIRGNPSTPLRGQNSAGCDAFIAQDACDTVRQDPQLEPAVKTCRDAKQVPLPVSVDYSSDNYDCQAIAGATCATAVGKTDAKGRVFPAKHLYYCDMRRMTNGTLVAHYCLPDASKPQTLKLSQEELDASGSVVAFVNPAPLPGDLLRLDRCTLSLRLTGGVNGRYAPQQGCVQREGVVQAAAPFWVTSGAPMVAMCAIEAQARDVNPWTMETCESVRFTGDRSCGCGVASRRCESGAGDVHNARLAAINEEPLRIADSVLRRDEDYFNILTTRRAFVNGTLSQFYREAQSPSVWAVTALADRAAIPDVPFQETNRWEEYTRSEAASGVLTTPLWLYRFPTQRSRVSQFSDAFLCKHFAPPPGSVAPAPEDACNRENNLAKRCGCSYCHATLEPTGAHWGRFGERNAQYLPPDLFPKFDARCRDCALAGDTTCNGECANYVMQAFDGEGASSLGLLRSYLYRTPDEEANIRGGPKRLVDKMMQTGELEACAVKNAWNAMLGHPMTDEEQRLYLDTLSRDFATSHHDFKALLLEVVTTAAYRRVD